MARELSRIKVSTSYELQKPPRWLKAWIYFWFTVGFMLSMVLGGLVVYVIIHFTLKYW